jgi:hypothetical protein
MDLARRSIQRRASSLSSSLQSPSDDDLRHILPSQLLCNLKELVLDTCHISDSKWPESWSQLTGLTMLNCAFTRAVPGFISDLANLRVLELKIWDVIYLKDLAPLRHTLTGLSSLKVMGVERLAELGAMSLDETE